MDVQHRLSPVLVARYCGPRSDTPCRIRIPEGLPSGLLIARCHLQAQHDPGASRLLCLEVSRDGALIAAEDFPFRFDGRGRGDVSAEFRALAGEPGDFELHVRVTTRDGGPAYTGMPHYEVSLAVWIPTVN